ncbi:hypothetical protein M426DRAFT_317505 [Hypoxylon sp. CI-4A]|nr:hypothetical protein M426DRAFT_317505 [Hypoxylon sp. CI-4A]
MCFDNHNNGNNRDQRDQREPPRLQSQLGSLANQRLSTLPGPGLPMTASSRRPKRLLDAFRLLHQTLYPSCLSPWKLRESVLGKGGPLAGESGRSGLWAFGLPGSTAASRNDPCYPCSSIHLGVPGYRTPRTVHVWY